MAQERGPPLGLSGRAAVALLERPLATREVAGVLYQERPEYAISVSCKAGSEPQLLVQSQGVETLAELVLSDVLGGVKVCLYEPDSFFSASWCELCDRSTGEAEHIWAQLGDEAIRLLRVAYHWRRAMWFQPVAIQATSMLLAARWPK